MSNQHENSEEATVNSQGDQAINPGGSDPVGGVEGKESGGTGSAVSDASDQQVSGADADGPDLRGADPLDEVSSRLAVLEEENSTLKDQYLRKSAEFENFRKRMQRDKEDSIQFANKQLLLDIVPIIDDFERAIRSAEDSKDFDAFHDGVVLIERQFTSMLERKWGLKRFESIGEEFDPSKHEAVTTEEIPEHESSVVLEDYQKGYLLHDKVLRSAKVKVSVPGSSSS